MLMRLINMMMMMTTVKIRMRMKMNENEDDHRKIITAVAHDLRTTFLNTKELDYLFTEE